MEKPYYLFRGQILGNVVEEGDNSVAENVFRRTETRAKTYNFKRFAIELNSEEQDMVAAIKNEEEYLSVLGDLLRKY